ncbi:NADPH-dependent FMN reductase [Kushneria marisflavi]|uniref:FMN reductase (NADPH) n=1 Tax=Kushneria marisflavi TaxID=157779 RepID=A0A240UMN1_9GAMM|nr:NADPH-dependent FMN reductase [Kushneria marisflavi]ART62744.1 FMN reductase (NADPH) [Kushneria marisflavi]RKD83848.1 SsuE family FMN reductase [Kushneria marisflavi]
MNVVTLAGSASVQSRSTALLAFMESQLHRRGIETRRFCADNFPSRALINADHTDPVIQAFQKTLARANAVIVATPVHQASFSGALKLLLDLAPQRGLEHCTVQALATGGSDQHLLMLDYALKPVLSSMGATHQLPGIYAGPADLGKCSNGHHMPGPDIRRRVEQAVETLASLLEARQVKPLKHLEKSTFSLAQAG